MLHACQVSHPEELEDILKLQQLYLRGYNPSGEEEEQGFLTVAHSLEQLKLMHGAEPSVIVKDGDILAGYALVMTRECQELIPVLIPMFQKIEQLFYQSKPLKNYRYYVMGQICVRKSYRAQGVFDMLYQKHKELFQPSYAFVVTEISTRNHRSWRAHRRIGFQTLNIFRDQTDEWNVVLWDWNS